MATTHQRVSGYLGELLRDHDPEELASRLEPQPDEPAPKVPKGAGITPQLVEKRWELLATRPELRDALLDSRTAATMECYERNVENFIGTAKVPIGLAGPLRVNGLFAHGDYYLPLATTEAALVASYSRGCQLISEVGGCAAMLLNEGVSRAPGFAFFTLREAGLFLTWVGSQFDAFAEVAAETTRFGRLADLQVTVEGNHVYLDLAFTVGDAAGQNMVTIATFAIVEYIREHSPVAPTAVFVETNLSGDKKASAQSFQGVRGKKVSAEVILPDELVTARLHTSAERLADYWRTTAMASVLTGTIGHQAHYANGLAALFIACGQDAACVAEAAVGVTRFETTADGALYASVTLPNLVVGSVGGGTVLPSQRACLEILGLAGPGKARALAEVCAGLALAGELSIAGAICASEFTRAHQTLARGDQRGQP
ncbi:MAG: hydroxymethylglutaryl-CoA reductase [bacterium]|nr:hydroxymethylglutaryl-CoA reductase [bacterium]